MTCSRTGRRGATDLARNQEDRMLGAPAGGGVTRRFVARQVPDALDVDALRADEVAEVADLDMVDVRRFVPGDGQEPRHRNPPAPHEREPDAPVREIGNETGRVSVRQRVGQYVEV